MKFILLLAVISCASHHQVKIPNFMKEKVCSVTSINYLQKYPAKTKNSSSKIEESTAKMLSLQPLVRKCYEQEMLETKSEPSFNLCLVTGYDKKGKQEFFEFSTNEIKLSENLISCLNNLKNREELNGLKDVTVMQPFRLYPAP